MKRFTFISLLTMLMIMVCTTTSADDDVDYDFAVKLENDYEANVNIYYKYINDGKEVEARGLDLTTPVAAGWLKLVIPEFVTYDGQNFKVTSIGDEAFTKWGIAYNGLTLPKSITKIGSKAFYNCYDGISEITIPENVTEIGEEAFGATVSYAGFNKVTSLMSTPCTISDNVFTSKTYESATFYVPYGTKDKYSEATGWKNFKNIVELEKTEPETMSVSIDNEEGIATYCPAVGVDFSSGEGATKIAAYIASSHDESTVKLIRVDQVAAGEGVLLRSLDGGSVTVEFPVAEDVQKHASNSFIGTLSDITVYNPVGADGTREIDWVNYVLSKKNGNVGFYKANSTKVAAGKAYLKLYMSTASSSRGFNIVFDDATGISEIAPMPSAENNVTYTLSGIRVKNPGKGIYIKNGQKVVIK